MKLGIVGMGMLIASSLWAVTPQSMRPKKEPQTRTGRVQTATSKSERNKQRNAHSQRKNKRAEAQMKQEQHPLAPPVEHYNTQLADQKTARKQYKKLKKEMKTSQADIRDEGGQRLTMSEMNYAQLCQRKNELIVMGEYETAIRYLERMLRIIERPEQVMLIMLELGELFMKMGNYRKAERMYLDFVKLYPSSQLAEQAYVKAIECSWLQTLPADRDQTKTESTLALIEEFLTRDSIYSADSVAQVMAINEKCRRVLAEGTMQIVKHYISSGHYTAAHKRLDALMTDMSKVASIEPELLYVRMELAQAEGNTAVAQELQADLQQRFPTYSLTVVAQAKPTWKRWLGI
jgi:outer membrane assembly lipoprotein YfiO